MNRPLHGGNLNWAATIAGCPVSALIDFSASINPLEIPQSAIAAITSNLEQLRAYPDPNYPQLRSHLAQHHQIDPEFILPGNGSAELLTWAARELAQQKFTYLITPTFSDYTRALNAFNANVINCPLNLPITQLSEGVPQGDTASHISFRTPSPPISPSPSYPKVFRKGIPLRIYPLGLQVPLSPYPQSGLLLNNPHNPTGKLWRKKEILPYLDKFNLVVIDEAFMDFLTPTEEQSLISMVRDYPKLVILRSLTKFYAMPGLRIGYAIAHPERLARWQQWRDPWSVNSLAVAASIAVLQDKEFQEQTWNWLAEARSHLLEKLRAIPGLNPLPGAVNYLLVETDFSATWLQEQLLIQYRLVIRDCLSFPELGDRYFRLAVRLPAENDLLIAAISSILASRN